MAYGLLHPGDPPGQEARSALEAIDREVRAEIARVGVPALEPR